MEMKEERQILLHRTFSISVQNQKSPLQDIPQAKHLDLVLQHLRQWTAMKKIPFKIAGNFFLPAYSKEFKEYVPIILVQIQFISVCES